MILSEMTANFRDHGFARRMILSETSHNFSGSCFGKLEPHPTVAFRVVGPVLAHLDEQEQVDGPVDHVADVAPRIRADRLDGLAALAEHDLALALALHINRLLYPGRAILELLPRLGFDRGLIWEFLVQAQIELFARDLGRQLAQRRIGDLILGIMPRSRRQMPRARWRP